MTDFFHMGGYGLYIWLSYGLAFVVLIANWLLPIFREKELLARIARRNRKRS